MKKALSIVFGLIVASLLVFSGCSNYTQEEVDQKLSVLENEKNTEKNTALDALKAELDAENLKLSEEKKALLEEKNTLEATSKAEKEELIEKLATFEEKQIEAEELANIVSYLIDDLEIGDSFGEVVSDRDLSILFDGEIEFDNEDYDAEEAVSLSGLEIASNKKDFGSKTYLTIPVGGFEYALVVDSSLPFNDIDSDETLKLRLLGENVEIVYWDSNKVVFNKGIEYDFVEGEMKTIDGKEIEVKVVGEDYAYVVVNGEGDKILEGENEFIAGIEVEAFDVLENDDGPDFVTLRIGKEVSVEVENGDEYEKDSLWEWVISQDSIGLTNVEEFYYIDEDDEFRALEAGNVVCLPDEYVCLRYDGLKEESFDDYTFALKGAYVKAKGDFRFGLLDFDRVYIDNSGVYDEDYVFINSNVQLGDSYMLLDTGANYFYIGNEIDISYALDEIFADTFDISGKDEDYLSNFGIIVQNPEDSVDDNDFKLSIPEEKAEATVTLLG